MVKTSYVLLVSAIIMLTASVVVAVIAVIFHPSRSEAARQLADLRPKIEKLLCEERIKNDPDVCEKYWFRAEMQPPKLEVNCTLTKARKDSITKTVEHVLSIDRTLDDNLKTLKRVYHHDKTARVKIAEKIRKLSLSVPKPSAHWYLGSQPDSLEGTGNMDRNISKWVHDNGKEVAHTLHDIEHHKDGKMLIRTEGWYNIYVQIDFQTNITQERKMTFGVTVMKTSGNKEETLSIIRDKRVVTCGHHHHKFHTCVVLNKSGVYKLVENDLLVVQVNMFNDHNQVQVTEHWSRSYFGVNFITSYNYVK